MELLNCPGLAVPAEVMHHVVNVESSYNPYAIGVVGGRLIRQPKTLQEAVATARMLESRGYNFSLGLAQVNRYNLVKYGLSSYEKAFEVCPNLQAGSRILAECHQRSGSDWGRSFSCYYSGNFTTGFKHGYVQKVFASMNREAAGASPIELAGQARPVRGKVSAMANPKLQPLTQAVRRSEPTAGIAIPPPSIHPQIVEAPAAAQTMPAAQSTMGVAVPAVAPESRSQPQTQGQQVDQAFVF